MKSTFPDQVLDVSAGNNVCYSSKPSLICSYSSAAVVPSAGAQSSNLLPVKQGEDCAKDLSRPMSYSKNS